MAVCEPILTSLIRRKRNQANIPELDSNISGDALSAKLSRVFFPEALSMLHNTLRIV